MDLGVPQADVGFRALRGRRRLHVLVGRHLALLHLNLFGVRPRQCHGRALRLDLLLQGIELRLRRGRAGPRLIELLR